MYTAIIEANHKNDEHKSYSICIIIVFAHNMIIVLNS